MRELGRQKVLTPSSSPVIVVVIFDSTTNLPVYAWVQESQTDVNNIKYGELVVPCVGLLDDVKITSSRPQTGGGLRRNTVTLSINVTNESGYPITDSPITKELYYGGKNLDDFYFGIFGIDRSYLFKDIREGASYGFYKVDNEISWDEVDGIQKLNLIDILLSKTNIVGATEETIPDSFFIYNPWMTDNVFPKAYGQVPRIKVLNAFPSFSIKNFTASISGTVRSNYTNVSTTIVLEDNVDESSLLLQAVTIGGRVRVRMHDGEVIEGTLSHDSMAGTITLNVVTRNTYYNRVTAYNDSLDGKTPDQWEKGPAAAPPSYATTNFSPYQTVIPNAKDLVLDPNSYMQADIEFFDGALLPADPTYLVTNCVCQIQGLLEQRKDVVIHSGWPDDRFGDKPNQGSVSGYYNGTSNDAYLPADQTPIWGYAGFEFLKFYDTTRKVNLFFNDPRVSVPGSGSVGQNWSLVNIAPTTIDKSCYIRNGYSRFDVNNVYVEGEGKLIKVPSGNITITQSGTFYGLSNLTKIAFTEIPLDMNIGAKSNTVYVDALYKNGSALESRAEAVLREIIKEDATLTTMLGETLTSPQTDNYLPYIGWIVKKETTLTEIIDRICYQCGITLRWSRDKFDIQLAGLNQDAQRDYVSAGPPDLPAGTYIEPLIPTTDIDEMLENTASLRIGNLKTNKYADGAKQEYVPLYFKCTYGGWEDPFYPAVRSNTNRNIKPYERVVEYHFDLINDASSFASAIGKSLSIGHPSGYALAQRALITDMSMEGCRWEAMEPIAFKNFPLISTPNETNAYYVDGRILYPKRSDAKPYIMGAVCAVEEVIYEFNVQNPKVSMYARNSQLFTIASGINITSPPGPPAKPNVPTDPNVPPNPGGGNSSFVVINYAGHRMLMDEVIDPNPPSISEIDSTATRTGPFTISVDADWVASKGWDYEIFIYSREPLIEVYDPTPRPAIEGAWLTGSTTGSFPDKLNDSYVPAVYNVTLNVNYLWFNDQSEGTFSKSLQLVLLRRWTRNGIPHEEEIDLEPVQVTRKDVTGITGS